MPFYVLLNKAPYTIEVQENNRPSDPWVQVEQDQCIPFWPKCEANMLRVKAADDKDIAKPFKIIEAQCTLVKLNNKVGNRFLEFCRPLNTKHFFVVWRYQC